jgi:hypothetical protein
MPDQLAVFDKLSNIQIEALCNVAFGGHGAGCNPRTLESLAKIEIDGFPLICKIVHRLYYEPFDTTIRTWEMSLPVHIKFCEWCSRQIPIKHQTRKGKK